jgi:hypothetical protein
MGRRVRRRECSLHEILCCAILTVREPKTPVLRKTLAAETPALPGAGIFEREAHASYLLGQVVNLKLDETLSRPSHTDSRQLSNTLRSLSSLLKHDIDTVNGPYYCAAVGMCNRYVMTR